MRCSAAAHAVQLALGGIFFDRVLSLWVASFELYYRLKGDDYGTAH